MATNILRAAADAELADRQWNAFAFAYYRDHGTFPPPTEKLSERVRQIRFPKALQSIVQHTMRPQLPQQALNLGAVYEVDIESDKCPVINWYVPPWEALQEMKHGFGADRVFEYKKCLGFGGNGVAVLFKEVDPVTKQFRRQVVVKKQFRPADVDVLQGERRLMNMLKNCAHIVQLVPVEERNLRRQYPDGSQKSMGELLIMEFLENGDLQDFVIQARQKGKLIPQRVLWHFFLCLTRACIGMAYPPNQFNNNANVSGPMTETVVPGQTQSPGRLCHFDLDARNIFIGALDPTSDEHNIAPVIKIGDFGLAEQVMPHQRDRYYERMRRQTKMNYYAPEQFTQEWDTIPHGCTMVKNHKVAGNYGSHTNVWSIGLVMETIITGCRPAAPPIAQLHDIPSPSPTAANPTWKFITYGKHLLHNAAAARIDRDLLNLITECQAHRPEDRPPLKYLLGKIQLNIRNKVYHRESDDEISSWFYEVANIATAPTVEGPEPGPKVTDERLDMDLDAMEIPDI